MSQENNCNYCKHSFKFKFPFRYWKQASEYLYKEAVRRMSPMETITFIFDQREWVLDNNSEPHECNGELSIELVEPVTCQDYRDRTGGTMDYHWSDIIDTTRTLKLLQKITSEDAERDMHIMVQDFFGSKKCHICAVHHIVTGEHAQIYLVEAWSHEL